MEIDTPNKKVATPTNPLAIAMTSPAVETPQEATPTPDYAAALSTDDSIQPHVPSLYNTGFFPKTPLSAASPLKSPQPSTSVTMATTSTSVESFSAEVIQSILSTTSSGPRPPEPTSIQHNLMQERQRLLQQMTTPIHTAVPVTEPVAKQPSNRLKLSVSYYCASYRNYFCYHSDSNWLLPRRYSVRHHI